LLRLGEPTAPADVQQYDSDERLLKQRDVGGPPYQGLAQRKDRGGGRGDLPQGCGHKRRLERVLDPEWFELIEGTNDAPGSRETPQTVHLNHDVHSVADGI